MLQKLFAFLLGHQRPKISLISHQKKKNIHFSTPSTSGSMSTASLQGCDGLCALDASSTRLRFWLNSTMRMEKGFFRLWHITHSTSKSCGERLQLADSAECTPFPRLDRGNSYPPPAHMAPTSLFNYRHPWHEEDVMCLHAVAWLEVYTRLSQFWAGGVGVGGRGSIQRQKQRGGGRGSEGETHTLCYWRCKNQCSASKAFPLLVPGVRLPSVAFNYSLRPKPEEPDWFSL